MSEETTNRIRDLADELLRLCGIRQGHIEIHAFNGEPDHIDLIDKSIKFKKKPTKIG